MHTRSDNAGFALPIEMMAAALVDRGVKLFLGARLSNVSIAQQGVALHFKGYDTPVMAHRALLNLPRPSLDALDQRGAACAMASDDARRSLAGSRPGSQQKVYAAYEDAWWRTKLRRATGSFSSSGSVPLAGRLHDGPDTCSACSRRDACLRCSGMLLVYYSKSHSYFSRLAEGGAAWRDGPLTLIFAGRALDEVHAVLMAEFAPALTARGVDAASIRPPTGLFIAEWSADDALTPGYASYSLPAGILAD